MPHPIETLMKNMAAITSNLNPATVEAIGATNIKPVSPRTLQFDCAPKADGTNRIKITVENGAFQVRGYKVEETDLLFAVQPGSLETAIKNIGNITLPATPTIY